MVAISALQITHAKQVTLDNTKLPIDTNGNQLLTGETSVLVHNGTYYFYMNNWGGCAGVDCCPSGNGCGERDRTAHVQSRSASNSRSTRQNQSPTIILSRTCFGRSKLLFQSSVTSVSGSMCLHEQSQRCCLRH